MENNTLCNRHSLGVNNHTKMYVTYTRIYGWSDYGGESSYQPGYRLENMMWMTLLVYDYIIPGEKGMEVRYYICKHCGNIVEKVKDKGVPVICCGEPMQELKAGVTDAAVEKHVPVYTIEGSHVHVVVGETKYPMIEEHFIEWITLNTNQGIYRKQLNPGQEPVADFCLCDGEQVEEVYAYCNLHGLWKC